MESSDQKTSSFSKLIFKGRLNRANFLIGMMIIFFVLITTVVYVVGFVLPEHPTRPLTTQEEIMGWLFIAPVLFFFIIMFISFYVRRMHDLGTENMNEIIDEDYRKKGIKDNWLHQILYVEVRLYPFYYLFTYKGDLATNKYGEPQRGIGILQIFGFK